MTDQSEVLTCGHCSNKGRMDIVACWRKDLSVEDERQPYSFDAHRCYETLICPSCDKPTFRSIYWHEAMEPDDISIEVYHPSVEEMSSGLPNSIHKAYESARRVKNIDANAFGVLIGRLLELVCEDQQAKGDSLYKKLKYLSEKGIIPDKLAKIALGLKDLRNIGAHATMGELTEKEVPLLEKLTRAILEYVYTAPLLAEQAENQLAKLKGK